MVSGGGSIVDIPAIASADGRFLLCANATVVRVYSSVTGFQVQQLVGHTATVTGVVLHPGNSNQVLTASCDGTIRLWDHEDGLAVKTFEIGQPVHHLVAPPRQGLLYFQMQKEAPKEAEKPHSKPPVLTVLEMAAEQIKCAVIVFTGGNQGSTHCLNNMRGSGKMSKDVEALYMSAADYEIQFTWDTDYRLQHKFQLRHFLIDSEKLQEQVYKLKNMSQMAASPNGNIVAAADTRVVLVWCTKTPTEKPLKLSHTKNLTCVAVDAAEDRVAAGDVSGRILIWHGLKAAVSEWQAGRSLPTIACTTHHWHPHQVCSLSFSLDSTYLLSGGEESVLVAWQLGSNAKRFLPRLSGKLSGISAIQSDAARYVITQEDNTVRIVNLAAMKVELSIHGLRKAPRRKSGEEFVAGSGVAALLPGGGELVVAGNNAMLQFYDAVLDRHLDKLQVAPRNASSLTETEEVAFGGIYGPPVEPQVTFVSFSEDGSGMATVDIRPDAGPGGSFSASLKFWDRRASGASASAAPIYSINTQVDDPHRGSVTGLAYHPTEHIAATTGSEGDLRVWVRFKVRNSSSGSSGWHWRCRTTASYEGEPMHSVAISSDGSLIAAGTGDSVTLWNLHSSELIAALPAPPWLDEDCSFCLLTFVPGTPFLAGAARGQGGLVVWNLLTADVWWDVPMPVTALGADPAESGSLAVGFSEKPSDKPGSACGSCVALFDAAEPEPKQVWHLPSSWASALLFPPPSSSLHASGLAESPKGLEPLLILTGDRRYTIGSMPDSQRDDEEGTSVAPVSAAETSAAAESSANDTQASAYETFVGRGRRESLHAEASRISGESEKLKVAALFDAPTHVLPPLETLAPAFMEMVLHRAGEHDTVVS